MLYTTLCILPHCFSGNLEIVWVVTEGLGIEEKFLHWAPPEQFTEECKTV